MMGPTHIVPVAATLAIHAHGDQLYGKYEPYIVHLAGVVETAAYFFELTQGAKLGHLLDLSLDELRATSWLHDTIEDTKLTKEDITDYCGGKVSRNVDLVSDPDLPGANRAEKKDVSLPRIATSADAVLVKLADRYRNSLSVLANRDRKKASMYVREFQAFRDVLQPTLPVAAIWMLLEFQVRDMLELLGEDRYPKNAHA